VYGLKASHVSQTFEAIAAEETIAKQLRVEEGFPLLLLTRILYDRAENAPVFYSQDFFRSDFARIHTEFSIRDGSAP
jgi:DNA-binding GntR family transcriptional regulator